MDQSRPGIWLPQRYIERLFKHCVMAPTTGIDLPSSFCFPQCLFHTSCQLSHANLLHLGALAFLCPVCPCTSMMQAVCPAMFVLIITLPEFAASSDFYVAASTASQLHGISTHVQAPIDAADGLPQQQITSLSTHTASTVQPVCVLQPDGIATVNTSYIYSILTPTNRCTAVP